MSLFYDKGEQNRGSTDTKFTETFTIYTIHAQKRIRLASIVEFYWVMGVNIQISSDEHGYSVKRCIKLSMTLKIRLPSLEFRIGIAMSKSLHVLLSFFWLAS